MPETGIKEAPVKGRPPTWEEEELFRWAEEAWRRSPQVVLDALRQMLILTAGLLGGAAALLNTMPIPLASKVIMCLLLMCSMGSSLFGFMPSDYSVCMNYLDELKDRRQQTMRRRMCCLWTAGGCLCLAAAFLVGGLIANAM